MILPFLDSNFILLFFFGSIFLGRPFTVTFAILSSQGYFSFWLVLLLAYLGQLTSDVGWFYLARTKFVNKIALRKSKILYRTLKQVTDRKIFKSDFFVLLAAKFLYGTETLTIFYLSRKGIKPKKFWAINIPAAAIWSFSLVGIAWLTGKGFTRLTNFFDDFRLALTILVIFLVLVFIIWKYVSRRIRKEQNIDLPNVFPSDSR